MTQRDSRTMADNADLFGEAGGADPGASAEVSRAAVAKQPGGASASAPAATTKFGTPLAERLRPQTIDEVIGQRHLLGPGKPLRVAFESGKPHSMIFWGPPGVGKTTLARLMAGAFDAHFVAISAVLGGVKEIREAVAVAQQQRERGRPTILFVDEVHRFNKSQQDAFLPHVESGLFTFIGATTENPSFEVNGALLSRARVYVLEPLSADELDGLFDRALAALGARAGQPQTTAGGPAIAFDTSARERLIGWADGDARRLLNAVEIVADAARGLGRDEVDGDFLEQALSQNLRRFDKGGDAFYDQISALHKSVRGSDPDAALYWLCRMLDGGADPRYLARRIVRMANEDIGLADPRATTIALDAAGIYERLGSPEGELALAQAVVYLACAAKSNAVYLAYKRARGFVAEHGSAPVPMHLRNAPTKLMKGLGHGKGYRYAHDEQGGYAAGERYFPDGVGRPVFYEPVERGLETKIREKLAWLRARDQATAGSDEPPSAS
ncbi:MAG TPA: replication-associated recombination protein A [Burkholderiaceae bacterium]|nr:replication-associated recombination protein A [Burkholderiaceae bacterium]